MREPILSEIASTISPDWRASAKIPSPVAPFLFALARKRTCAQILL